MRENDPKIDAKDQADPESSAESVQDWNDAESDTGSDESEPE